MTIRSYYFRYWNRNDGPFV